MENNHDDPSLMVLLIIGIVLALILNRCENKRIERELMNEPNCEMIWKN